MAVKEAIEMTGQENPYVAPQSDVEGVEIENQEFYQPLPWTASGRIGRVRYLAYHMLGMLLVMAAMGLTLITSNSAIVGLLGLIYGATAIALYVYTFIWARRRLNDLGYSGWFQLVALIPLVNIILFLYLMFAPGEKETNKWGPRPLPSRPALLILALIMPLGVIGVFSAVAFPAYQDYVERAKASPYEYSSDDSDYAETDGEYSAE
jgi:uncharacterized membrane protein YhaH (DUF805 family)